MNRTILVIGIIFLFIGISINPTIAVLNSKDDNTPPVTWHELNPPEPDGENGWYTYVEVTICAEDLESGVEIILFRLYGGVWQSGPGGNPGNCISILFTAPDDGEPVLIEYTAIDNAGNQAPIKSFSIKYDPTVPTVDHTFEVVGGNQWQGWDLLFTAIATDTTSGMDRVEFYLNEGLQDIVYGSGPIYQWGFRYHGDLQIDVIADAYDRAGNMASDIATWRDKSTSNVLSSSISIPDDTTPPEVELVYDVYWNGVDWFLIFEAICSDDTGIDRVEFTRNSLVQCVCEWEPYQWLVPIENHWNSIICAVAYDYAGNSAEDCIDFRSRSNEIEPLYNCRGIFKIVGFGEEGYILTINKSGPGIFFRHVEILSRDSMDIEGYYFSSEFPFIKSFYKTTRHIVAHKCFVTFEGMIYPGHELIRALAIGDIEWS